MYSGKSNIDNSMENKKNKNVKTLTQSLLQAANLGWRKDALNNVLNASGNRVEIKSESSSLESKSIGQSKRKSKEKQIKEVMSSSDSENDVISNNISLKNENKVKSESSSLESKSIGQSKRKSKEKQKRQSLCEDQEEEEYVQKRIKQIKEEVMSSSDSENYVVSNNISLKNENEDICNSNPVASDSDSSTEFTAAASQLKRKSNEKISSSNSDSESDTSKLLHKSPDRDRKGTLLVKRQKIKKSRDIKSRNDYSSSDDSTSTENDLPGKHNFKTINRSNEKEDVKLAKSLQESSKLLENFVQGRNYETVVNKTGNLSNLINEHHEIYLMRISKNIDPHLLLNKAISLDASTKINCNGNTYQCDVNCGDNNPITLMNFDELLQFKSKGTITIREDFELNTENIDMKAVDDIPDYPEHCKTRHPLFGDKYKKKIRLPEDILGKLENTAYHASKIVKKKKKRKDKSKEDIVTEDIGNLDIFKLLEEHEKQKLQVDNEAKETVNKRKRKRHEEDSEDLSKNKLDMELDSFIPQMFQDDKNTESVTNDYEVSPAKKKKKKRTRSTDIDTNENLIPTTDWDGFKVKKKKKKNTSECPTLNASQEKFHCNESTSSMEMLKHKEKVNKRKRKPYEEDSQDFSLDMEVDSIIAQMFQDDKNIESLTNDYDVPPAKKKKKKRTRSPDIETNEKLIATTDCDEFKAKKKKKKKTSECPTLNAPQDKFLSNESTSNIEVLKYKQKEKERVNPINSTLKPTSDGNDRGFDLNVSEIPIVKKKKKKHKKHRDSIDAFIDNLIRDVA